MSQLQIIFPSADNKLPIKGKKLSKRQEDSIMNFTTKRLLGKSFKRK